MFSILKNDKNTCFYKNFMGKFCLNINCKQINKFVCQDEKCLQCSSLHKFCVKFSTESVIQIIKQKISHTDELKNKISTIFEDLIKKIQQLQKNTIQSIDSNLKYANLSQNQRKIYELFIQNKGSLAFFSHNILLSIVQNIHESINKFNDISNKYTHEIQNYKKLCEKQLEKTNQNLKILVNQNHNLNEIINKKYIIQPHNDYKMRQKLQICDKQQQIYVLKKYERKQFKQFKYSSLQKIQNKPAYQVQINCHVEKKNESSKKIQPKQQLIPQMIRHQSRKQQNNFNEPIKNQNYIVSPIKQQNNINPSNKLSMIDQSIKQKKSDILTTSEQYQIIRYFFAPKTVKDIKLMFKANQNNFQMLKYYQKHGHQKNILILCQTTMNKIIGGYTPFSLKPQSSNGNQWIPDINKSSFIFSLTQKDKFILKQKLCALYYYKDMNEICFGSSQLKITDKSNQNNYNQTNLYTHYYSPMYGKYTHNQESYMKLNGNPNKFFVAKQWEMFVVDFTLGYNAQ